MGEIKGINLEVEIWNALLKDREFGPELHKLLEIGELIWQKGWAEANAGNVSLRLSPVLVQKLANLSEKVIPDLNWFLVSATGSRYREFQKLGFTNFVLAGCNPEDIDIKYVFVPETRKPTSEWATHLSIQSWLQANRSKDKVVLHAHPEDWIIISNLPQFKKDSQSLARKICQSLPELDIYLPDRFTLLPYAAAGSLELAELTVTAMNQTNVVIWEKHGIVVTAENMNVAFDYLEIMAKAAKVYLASR